MTVMLASKKRSTQFIMQGSSLRSSLPEEILEVMHLQPSDLDRLRTFAGQGRS